MVLCRAVDTLFLYFGFSGCPFVSTDVGVSVADRDAPCVSSVSYTHLTVGMVKYPMMPMQRNTIYTPSLEYSEKFGSALSLIHI